MCKVKVDKSFQKFVDEILNALGDLTDYPSDEDRVKYYHEAVKIALDQLSKQQLIDLLFFALIEREIFSDEFEATILRRKNETP